MKQSIFFLLIFLAHATVAQVKIGDHPQSIGTSSVLELESTNKALVLSRVASTAAITAPVNGMMIYDNSLKCVRAYEDGAWTGCGLVKLPAVAGLTCGSASFSPAALNKNEAYSGTLTVPYTGGNGADYAAGVPVPSTGVSGLMATLQSGTLNVGGGNLTFAVTGTPAVGGTASFAISFGGQNCIVTVAVSNFPSAYTATTTLVASNHLTSAVLPYFYDNLITYSTQNTVVSNMQTLRLHQTASDVVKTVLNNVIPAGGKIKIRWSRFEKATGLGLIVDFQNGVTTSQTSINTLTGSMANSVQTASGSDMTITTDVVASTNTITIKSSEDGVGEDPILLEIEVYDDNGNKIPIN